MGRIWESINASNQHMLTHVPIGQIAGSPLCVEVGVCDHWLTFGDVSEVDAWDIGGWHKKIEDDKTVLLKMNPKYENYVDDSY